MEADLERLTPNAEALHVYALRYAMNKHDGAASVVMEEIVKNWGRMGESTQVLIQSAIAAESPFIADFWEPILELEIGG